MWNAVDELLTQAIKAGDFPGCAVAAGQGGRVLYTKVCGHLVRDGAREVTHATCYDVGTLTQVMATMPLCMAAVEKGLCSLDDPLSLFFPDVPADKRDITLHHLLTHTSGLSPRFLLPEEANSDRDAARALLAHPLAGSVGGKVRDSAMGFLLLGLLLEKVFSMPLDEAVKRFVTAPMGMPHTGYLPSGDDVAPTATPDENGEPQAGFPLDRNARFLHGVAGHAGLFTSLEDIARMASMFARNGQTDDGVVFAQRSIHLATTERTRVPGDARGFGFHITKRQNPFLGHLWPSDGFGLQDPDSGSLLAVSPNDGFFVTVLLNAGSVPGGRKNDDRARKLLLNAAYAAFQHESAEK